jgi:WD40 repeat protein
VSFHPDGAHLLSGGRQPGDVKLWDLTRHPERLMLPGCNAQAVAFDPANGQVRLASITGRLQSRNPKTGEIREQGRIDLIDISVFEKWITPAQVAAFSGDCRRLVGIASDTRAVKVWDTETRQELAVLNDLKNRVVHVAITPDGNRVAAVDWPGKKSGLSREVRVWDVGTGQCLPPFSAAAGASVYVHGAVALSPDGTRIAVDDYGADGPSARVRVIDLASRRELLSLPAGEEEVTCLAFDTDGRLLAAGQGDGKVTVWDTSGRRLLEDSMERGVYRLAFHPDGKRLAGVNREQVKVWDVGLGKEVVTLRGPPPPSDGGFNPTLAWSHDGRRLAASNWDASVSVWDSDEHDGRRQVPQQPLTAWHLAQALAALQGRQPAAAGFHLNRVRSAETLDFPSRMQRGRLFARLGDWDRAEADFTAGFADHAPDDSEMWLDHARTKVIRGDLEGFRRVARRMVAYFDANHIVPRPALVRVSVLAPGAVADPATTVRLAEGLLADNPGQADSMFLLGLAHYRAGQWERAAARAQEALEADSDHAWVRWPLLALAHQRQGHKDEGHRWLDKAAERHRRITQQLRQETGGFALPPDWPDFEILHAEAVALIQDPRPE